MYKSCYGGRGSKRGNWCRSGNKFEKWAKRQAAWRQGPAVNVEESSDKYELSVYAAGYEKSNFSLALEDDILTVSASVSQEEPGADRNWRRREYTPRAFSRRFELNDKVNQEAITAAYNDGVLLITLPKKEDAQSSKHEIFVG